MKNALKFMLSIFLVAVMLLSVTAISTAKNSKKSESATDSTIQSSVTKDNWCNNTDINHDGTVSIADYIEVSSHFNEVGCGTTNNWCANTDINRDGTTSISDFIDLAAAFNTVGCTGSALAGQAVVLVSSCSALNQPDTKYLLTADIDPATSPCMVISASNVELDCQNHAIRNGAFNGASNNFGVVASNVMNATVRNCVIDSMINGAIQFDNAQNSFISGNTLTRSGSGVILQQSSKAILNNNNINNNNGANAVGIDSNSHYTQVLNNVLSNNDQGISVRGNHTVVSNNVINNNKGTGIGLVWNTNTTVTSNTVNSNSLYGVALSGKVSNSIFRNNFANNNGKNGFYFISTSSNNQVINSTANNNGENGFLLEKSNGNSIINSTANSNRIDGFFLRGSSSNTLRGNTANRNAGSSIIYNVGGFVLQLYSPSDPTPSANNNLISNTANDNNVEGFYVDYASPGNSLLNNNATNNNQTGFYIISNTNTITGNSGSKNGYRGLQLESGGGNSVNNNKFCSNLQDFLCTFGSNSNSGSGNIMTSVTQCSDGWPVLGINYNLC
ncbi:right-handed parallel beta-helix repeat-containing protein [Candidatus Pacearchaeota archaeon]|nr:right-handed parallel beta-helix repeat-containing protein [Candidatus Pacearchaeota archaeon]